MAERSLRLLAVGVGRPAETFLVRMLTGLAGRGVEVTVAGPRDPRIPDVRWLPLLSSSVPKLGRLTQLSSWLPRLPAVLRSRARAGVSWRRAIREAPFFADRWDVVYFPWTTHLAHMPVVSDIAVPVVVSCRGSQVTVAPHNTERRSVADGLRTAFGAAAAIHCVSEAIAEEAGRFGAEREKMVIIRPAVDPGYFTPAAGAPRPTTVGRLRIAMTGALIWRKGYEYALVALRRLLDRGIPAEVAIAGDGPDEQRVRYTIEDLALGDQVRLLGRRPVGEIREHLRRSDIYLLSSLEEGISNAALEAMSCGLPVVTTACGGMAEAVEDGAEGFVVPMRDPGAIADALERLAASEELRTRMGFAARDRIVREFALDDQISAWTRLLESVSDRPESGSPR